jgi:hypothetical protein
MLSSGVHTDYFMTSTPGIDRNQSRQSEFFTVSVYLPIALVKKRLLSPDMFCGWSS